MYIYSITCIVWVQLINSNSVLLAVGRLNDVLDFYDFVVGGYKIYVCCLVVKPGVLICYVGEHWRFAD